MNRHIKNIYFVVLFFFVRIKVTGQEVPPPPTPGGPFPGLVVPIDDNLLVALGLGVILGLWYYRRKKLFSQ